MGDEYGEHYQFLVKEEFELGVTPSTAVNKQGKHILACVHAAVDMTDSLAVGPSQVRDGTQQVNEEILAVQNRLDEQAKVLANLLGSATNLSNVVATRLDNIEKVLGTLPEAVAKMSTGATTNRDEEVNSLIVENDALTTQLSVLEQKLDARRQRDTRVLDLLHQLSEPLTPIELNTMHLGANIGAVTIQDPFTEVEKGPDTDAPLAPIE
jgi:uncharacterized phage infection (PIP) family protein YhgE